MKILPLLIASLLTAQAASANFQTWTTTTGDTVRARMVGVYGTRVFLETRGSRGVVKVPYPFLNKEGKERADLWRAEYASRQGEYTPVGESESKVSRFLARNLVRYEEGELAYYDFETANEPEFYAFYYSAKWCGPCRRFTPDLVEFYNDMRKEGYDDFEIVFVSSDRSKSQMRQYMDEDAMPWPAVKFGKREHTLLEKMSGNGIPCLVITDRKGRILVHSYKDGEYVGPRHPKNLLRAFLVSSKLLRDSANAGDS